jgi:hypothetical protein
MAPRSSPAVALAATVLLAVACPVASADPQGDASAKTRGSNAAAVPGGAGATDGGAQALATDTVTTAPVAPAEVLPTATVAQQGGSVTPLAPASSTPPTPPATSPPPAPQEAATGTATRTPAVTPPHETLSGGEAARPLPPAPPAAPPRVEAPKPAATTQTVSPPAPSSPDPTGGAPAPPAPPKPPAPTRDHELEPLLTNADRELRDVQGQIGALERRLDTGGFPSTPALVRLRHGLDRIAPMLLALESRLDKAPPLTPRQKTLLQRVHSRLERARGSAGDLIAAFVRSGAWSPALHLLLRELERFVAFDSVTAAAPVARPAPAPPGAPAPVPYTAYTQTQAAPTAAPRDGAAAHSPGRRGDGRHATGQRDPGSPEDVPPSSPAAGSASAGPGGAFFAGGLAALAALLAAPALAGPRMRLHPVAARLYRALFLTPLERPG